MQISTDCWSCASPPGLGDVQVLEVNPDLLGFASCLLEEVLHQLSSPAAGTPL